MVAMIPASSTSLLKVTMTLFRPIPLVVNILYNYTFSFARLEPPVPTTVPKLLEKRSKQLLVLPGETYRGDGPIIFTKILYTPEKNGGSWSSIISKSSN